MSNVLKVSLSLYIPEGFAQSRHRARAPFVYASACQPASLWNELLSVALAAPEIRAGRKWVASTRFLGPLNQSDNRVCSGN